MSKRTNGVRQKSTVKIVLFDHVESVSVEQYASRITSQMGEEVSPTPFSRKQLQIAGYIQ